MGGKLIVTVMLIYIHWAITAHSVKLLDKKSFGESYSSLHQKSINSFCSLNRSQKGPLLSQILRMTSKFEFDLYLLMLKGP